jgi:hypothetical protein
MHWFYEDANSLFVRAYDAKRVEALPGNELLRDLPLERDAVGTLPGHFL